MKVNVTNDKLKLQLFICVPKGNEDNFSLDCIHSLIKEGYPYFRRQYGVIYMQIHLLLNFGSYQSIQELVLNYKYVFHEIKRSLCLCTLILISH